MNFSTYIHTYIRVSTFIFVGINQSAELLRKLNVHYNNKNNNNNKTEESNNNQNKLIKSKVNAVIILKKI